MRSKKRSKYKLLARSISSYIGLQLGAGRVDNDADDLLHEVVHKVVPVVDKQQLQERLGHVVLEEVVEGQFVVRTGGEVRHEHLQELEACGAERALATPVGLSRKRENLHEFREALRHGKQHVTGRECRARINVLALLGCLTTCCEALCCGEWLHVVDVPLEQGADHIDATRTKC